MDGAVCVGGQGRVVIDLSETAVVIDDAATLLVVIAANSYPRFTPTTQLGPIARRVEALTFDISFDSRWLCMSRVTYIKRFM